MSARISVSPLEAAVGDRIEVRLTLEAPGSSRIGLRSPGNDAARTRLSASPWQFARKGETWTLTRTEIWAGFEPGRSLDWRYGLTIGGPAGNGQTSEIVSQAVKIVSVLPSTEKNPAPAPFAPPRSRTYVPWPAVALAALLLLAAILLARRRRSRGASISEATDDEIFDRRIASLESELARGIPGGAFFDGLAETTRWYLERKLGFSASKLTSTEIAASLRSDPRGLPATEVASTLAACDGYRFARREELSADAANAISEVRQAAAKIRTALTPADAPPERMSA
jgi:hypothetical protein